MFLKSRLFGSQRINQIKNVLGKINMMRFSQLEAKAILVEMSPEDLSITKAQQHDSQTRYIKKVDFTKEEDQLLKEKLEAEKEYFEMIVDPVKKKEFFDKISQIKDDDHQHLKFIKKKIQKLVQNELEELGFKQQLEQEEIEKLSTDAYKEVKNESAFYFQIDKEKRDKNLKILNFKAPGNKFRKPSVLLPHEHVHIQHYIDHESLTDEKLQEIYGYYSHIIDLHISQIRPQNLQEVSYIPEKFTKVESIWDHHSSLNNMFFEYYHRFREPNRTWFSQTQELNHWEMLKNRPTTHHYDHDRGSKYEVEWTDEQKFPHVASRLGYPILKEEPIDRIFGFERAPAHPGYQFQPFVQTPSLDPDPTLNFEKGEVIYENPKVLEWVRFWKTLCGTLLLSWPAFYTFEIYAADGVPSLKWLAETANWWQVPMQFQDSSDWGLEEYRYCDDHDYMNLQYSGKRTMGRLSHSFYVVAVLTFLKIIDCDYVTRMQYNKDKDLVFVYRPNGLWNEHEYVYEVHHLEQMVPGVVTSIQNLSSQREDGILTVHCMDTRDYMKFYNEEKYWNINTRDEFMKSTNTLWRGLGDADSGHIFKYYVPLDEEIRLRREKVQRELAAAIEKHGKVVLQESHEDQFYEAIQNKKQEVATV